MENEAKKEQADLYQNRREIKNNIRPFRYEKYHRDFLSNYIKENRIFLLKVIGLIAAQALIEVVALIFINGQTRERIYSALHTNLLFGLSLTIIAGAFLYLFITYLSIKYERIAVLSLINNLRNKLFGIILKQSANQITNEKKADFIAKISYHLPILSLGVDHSLFGLLRWIISALVIMALGAALGSQLFFMTLCVVVISLLIGVIAFFVAHHYISQEVTSYSQIMKHITLSLTEFDSLKSHHQENAVLDELQAKVSIDTYFRVRRDIWLRYFNRVLFTILFIGSIVCFAVAFSHPDIISFFYDPASTILFGILTLYCLKILYEAVQTGLYLPPLKLGLLLCIPEEKSSHFVVSKLQKWQQIILKSNKTKLFKEGGYLKDFVLTINARSHYLFIGEKESGKTCLAHVFAGDPQFNENGWLIIVDEQRYNMDYWSKKYSDRYFFTPYAKSEKTIGELILGKENRFITETDIVRIYTLCNKYDVFSTILSKKRFTGDSAKSITNNQGALFAIQVLYSIINKISLIIIDNYWIDLGYEEVEILIKILAEELPHSSILVFARKKNNILDFNSCYEVKTHEITKIS